MGARLADAVAPYVSGSRHDIALVLSAALMRRGVRPEHAPQVIAHALRPHSSDVAARVRDAEDTARKFIERRRINSDLSVWPGIDLEVRRIFGELPEVPTGDRAQTLEETTRRMAETMRHPGDGVSIIRAQCGLGKTTTWRQVAVERASSEEKGNKSAISVPEHKIAIEQLDELRAAGHRALRIFSPLAMRREDGTPECKYHRVGNALAAGGISVSVALCRGCDYRECRAVGGQDGDDGARIMIGVHEQIGQLSSFVGSRGLLAIDEPPPLHNTICLSLDDLKRAMTELRGGWFAKSYTRAMLPIVDGVIRWMEAGVDEQAGPITRGLVDVDPGLENDAYDETGEVSAVGWAENAMGERPGTGVPIAEGMRMRLRLDYRSAEAVGNAANVLRLLRRAVMDEDDVAASVEERVGARILVLQALEAPMHNALRRGGPTLVMAADAEVVKPLIERAVGYAPPVHTFVVDEPLVERTLWLVPRATRTGWLNIEVHVPAIVMALEAAVEWYLEAPTDRPLAIVTYQKVEEAILGGKNAHEELRDRLQPVLARLPQPPLTKHFGALRGVNEWKELDSLVTLGDPYPNVDTLRRQMEWIQTGTSSVVTPENWAQMHAAAELEQAHGRLRTVHRTRPARQLHVGLVTPAGWSDYHVRDGPPGRPRAPPESSEESFAALVAKVGGTYAAAKRLGHAPRTLQRWISSGKAPAEAVRRLRTS